MGLIQDQYAALEDRYSALAESLGMRYDSGNRVICGQRDGFGMILYAQESGRGISRYLSSFTLSHVNVAAARPTGQMLTAAEKQELANNVKYLGFVQQDGYDIIIPQVAAGNLLSETEEYQQEQARKLDYLCSFLRDKGYRPCCSRCGHEAQVSPFRLGDSYQHLCMACEADVRSRLASPKQQRKENLVLGMVGALLGALPGVAAIVFALQSEVMLPLVMFGAAMVICILLGYDRLGGRLTKKAAVIGGIVMLPMIYVADRLDWAIRLYKNGTAARFKLNFWQCFMEVPGMISRNVIHWESYSERLVAVYLFLLLGAVPTFIYLFRGNKGRGQLTRLG